jgi:outer membrane lipoprotein carrier protein
MKAARLALVPLVLLLAAPLRPADAVDTARRLENAVKAIRTLRADFIQLYYPASIAEPMRETGELFLQKPDLMRWEYKKPEKKVFLASKGRFEMYHASDNQLVRSAIPPEAYDSDIIGILIGSKSLIQSYRIENVSFPTNSIDIRQIKLTPLQESDYSHLLIEVDDKTGLLRRAILIEWAGNKREYIFNRLKPNVDLPRDAFVLKPPPGCEIIEDTGA